MARGAGSFLTIILSMVIGATLVLLMQLKLSPSSNTNSTIDQPVAPPPVVPATVSARGDLAAIEKTTIDIFRESSPSVVFITTANVQHDIFRRNAMEIPRGTGSGFVWDESGHVVTNFHVIAGSHLQRVTLADQTVYDAKVVGAYPAKDLAVLHIDTSKHGIKLRPTPVGESSNLIVGQYVFAIGNPFGLDHTLSTGVISGLGREIMSMNQRPIQGVVQTDAAINPGNSGGPLLDSAGRLIGVNTAIYSPSGASAGVGFAVPVDTVKDIVTQLITHGKVARPALGIQLDDRLSARLGINGVLIVGVDPNGGAAKAGLKPTLWDSRTGRLVLGDIIVGINGEKIENTLDLFRALDGQEVGKAVTVALVRGKEELNVEVELGQIVE